MCKLSLYLYIAGMRKAITFSQLVGFKTKAEVVVLAGPD